MTDNRVLVDENGKESVFVNRSDGYAVARIKEMGVPQIIISTETNPVVERRAEKLGIEVIHGIIDKGETLRGYCASQGIELSKVFFVGNDVNDLPAFNISGIKGAPADAEKEILRQADWISVKSGGYGVIRDLYGLLKKEQ